MSQGGSENYEKIVKISGQRFKWNIQNFELIWKVCPDWHMIKLTHDKIDTWQN